MSNIGSYTNRSFSENQKFLVLDPSTGTTSLVLGSDLVDYITPQLNAVKAESTRLAAENTDYDVGQVIQTTGATSPGDDFAAVYLVVEGGTGDFPMINGNDLLVIRGDEFLREQLIQNTAGNGSDLVAHTGTDDTVTEALDKRTIYVGSVAELESLSLEVGTNVYLTQDGRAGDFVVKSGAPPSDPQKGIYIVLANGNYAERQFQGVIVPSWFGAVGDGSTDDTTALDAFFELGLKNNHHMFLGTRLENYKTTSLISKDMASYVAVASPAEYGRCFIFGTGATITNTVSDILLIDNFNNSEISGLRFVGSTDGYVTRNANKGLRIGRMYRSKCSFIEASGFGVGISVEYSLTPVVELCQTFYCGVHIDLNDQRPTSTANGVSNVGWVKSNIILAYFGNSDPNKNLSDIGIRVQRAEPVKIENNTFEYCSFGLLLTNVAAAEINQNYFEHGSSGADITLQSGFSDTILVTNNRMSAGNGDGVNPGGQRPIDLQITRDIIAYNNRVSDYDDSNVVPALKTSLAGIACRESYLAGQRTYGPNFESIKKNSTNVEIDYTLVGSATLDVFSIDFTDSGEARGSIVQINSAGESSTGGALAVIDTVSAVRKQSGTVSESSVPVNHLIAGGDDIVWAVSISGQVATYSVTNGTATNRRFHSTMKHTVGFLSGSMPKVTVLV